MCFGGGWDWCAFYFLFLFIFLLFLAAKDRGVAGRKSSLTWMLLVWSILNVEWVCMCACMGLCVCCVCVCVPCVSGYTMCVVLCGFVCDFVTNSLHSLTGHNIWRSFNVGIFAWCACHINSDVICCGTLLWPQVTKRLQHHCTDDSQWSAQGGHAFFI